MKVIASLSIRVDRIFTFFLLTAFMAVTVFPSTSSLAASIALPIPGTMIQITNSFKPAEIKGIKVDPLNPLLFEFLIDPGEVSLNKDQKREEYQKLIKYFLAALTTPEKDLWVNLSPYEHERIISNNFGQTQMGNDMLAQDYILKQLTASLIYPEDGFGKEFWHKINEKARLESIHSNIPINTFNKVWILPQSATIFEEGNVAMVVESRLKVMMEEDYLALDRNRNAGSNVLLEKNDAHQNASEMMRKIIIPAIEKEINEGKNFIQLRQMYQSMVLASWFKQRLKKNVLNRVYSNKDMNKGMKLENPRANEEIYQRYLQAYKKGVFNYIKEEADTGSGKMIPKKYFSGGANMSMLALEKGVIKTTSLKLPSFGNRLLDNVTVQLRIQALAIMFWAGISFTPSFAETPVSKVTKDTIQAMGLTVNDYYGLRAISILQRNDFGLLNLNEIHELNFALEHIGERQKTDLLSLEAIQRLKSIRDFMLSWVKNAVDNNAARTAPVSDDTQTFFREEIKKSRLEEKETLVINPANSFLRIHDGVNEVNKGIFNLKPLVLTEMAGSAIKSLELTVDDFYAIRALNILEKIREPGQFEERRVAQEFIEVVNSIPIQPSEGSKLTIEARTALRTFMTSLMPIFELGGYIPVEKDSLDKVFAVLKGSGLDDKKEMVANAVEYEIVQKYERRILEAYVALENFSRTADMSKLESIKSLSEDLDKILVPGFSRDLDLIEKKLPPGFVLQLREFSQRVKSGEIKTEEKDEVLFEAKTLTDPWVAFIRNIVPKGQPLDKNDAMLTKGGIDFDSKYLQMNIQGSGESSAIPPGFEWLLKAPIEGFSSEIIDIQTGSVSELSFFKGIQMLDNP